MRLFKKFLPLLIIAVFMVQAKQATAKGYVGLEGGYAERIPASVNGIKAVNPVHGRGGNIGVNYGTLWGLGKIFSIGAEGFASYMGVVFKLPASTETLHTFTVGAGLVFDFAVHKMVSVQLRANIGYMVVDTFAGVSPSGWMSGAHWRVLSGVIIKPTARIGIPIEIGYIGTYSTNGGIAQTATVKWLHHGYQILTGVKLYFG